MKNSFNTSIRAFLFTGTLITAHLAPAQVVEQVETKTTTSLGTISEFGPERILIKTEESAEPIRYSYSKTTTYVDEEGNPVSVKTIKSGLPVTIYYSRVGDTMVATKVLVRKAVAVPAPAATPEIVGTTETTTTKTLGTITEFGADRILVRTETSTAPLRYTFTKKTTYVDESGAAVAVQTVKSGLPVTIYYTKVGDAMVATKVVVRKVVAVPAAPPVVETKRTTKTTTIEEKAKAKDHDDDDDDDDDDDLED